MRIFKTDKKLKFAILFISVLLVLIFAVFILNKFSCKTKNPIPNKDNSAYFQESDYNLDHLDEKTKKMAIEYLKKAAEMGEPQAKDILGSYLIDGKYIRRDVEMGNNLRNEYKLFLRNHADSITH